METNACYKYKKPKHYVKDCPFKKRASKLNQIEPIMKRQNYAHRKDISCQASFEEEEYRRWYNNNYCIEKPISWSTMSRDLFRPVKRNISVLAYLN